MECKGMGNVVKIKEILTLLKKEMVTIPLLQKTHLSEIEYLKLKRDWIGQVYFS